MVQGNGICKSEGTILELKIRFRIPEHDTQVLCVMWFLMKNSTRRTHYINVSLGNQANYVQRVSKMQTLNNRRTEVFEEQGKGLTT